MKTTNESYQNLTQTTNLQNLTYSELKNLYSTVYHSLGEAIDNDDIESHDKILPVLRAIKTEIQTRNEVTPTTTINNQNISILDVHNIKDELVDIRKYQHQFKKTIKARISQNNGVSWIKQLQEFYHVDLLLSKIKHTSTAREILDLLKNTKYLKKDISIIGSS